MLIQKTIKPQAVCGNGTQMSKSAMRIGVVADFNGQNLGVLLEKLATAPRVVSKLAPYGRTMELLLDQSASFWSSAYDALILWTLPERVIAEFQRVLSFKEFSMEELLAEVDSFAALVQSIPESVRTVVLPSWVAPQLQRGWGSLDLANGIGIANTLMRMNLRLADHCKGEKRLVLLDTQKWLSNVGKGAYSPKLWYRSKTPFHQQVFQEAAEDVLAVLRGIDGRNKKVIVLDLDNTLWGGILGEEGWERLRLGGHDPAGEAYAEFQRALKALVNRGVVLAIASKNEEAFALEAIKCHPEMVLRLEDFAAWRINWEDKAENIVRLLAGLNLGLESAVFLDDSPFERARIREALPDVLVPELPEDAMDYASFVRNLKCFDTPFISREDRARTTMYVADRQRSVLKENVGSLERWLEMLELRVVVEVLSETNLERAVQLFNKTNQMNLSTRRLTARELLDWSKADGHRFWTFRVADRFGDYGVCGLSSLAREGSRGRVVDFLMSCRVMGRGVEEIMLSTAAQYARRFGCEDLYVEFIPSPKNQPCERWLDKHPCLSREKNRFHLSLDDSVGFPPHIEVAGNEL